MTADLIAYYNEVRRYLDCPKSEEESFLARVNRQILEMQAENPDFSYDDLVSFLGSPRDLAYHFTDNIDPQIIYAHHQKKRRFRIARIVCIIAVISVLLTSTFYTTHLKSSIHVVRTDSFSYLN